MKEGVGITNQEELGEAFKVLADKVGPVVLGTINRQQSYIRMVARKLLQLRKTPPDASKMENIVEGLIKRAFFHQHAITREEAAKDFGFDNLDNPDEELESLLWDLYLSYESELGVGEFIKAEELFQSSDADEKTVSNLNGITIESDSLKSQFRGDLIVMRNRRPLPNLNLNMNLALPLLQGGQLDPNALRQLQMQIQQTVQEELRRQAAVTGYGIRWQNDGWVTIKPEAR